MVRALAPDTATRLEHGEVCAAISRAVVRLHALAYGKGPAKASTHVRDKQFVLCLLRDPFTRSERTFIAAGRTDVVCENRRVFHEMLERQLRATVEDLTGHRVTAFVPGVSIEADLVSQLFILDPAE